MPYFGSTLFVASLVALFLLSLGGSLLLAAALAPRAVAATASAQHRRPLGSLLLGLPALGLLALPTAALLTGPVGARALGALLAMAGVGAALVGLAGTAHRVGWVLAPRGTPAGQVLRGAAVLELAMLLPFFGWFVVLPLALAAGLGSALLALGARSKAAAPAAAPPEASSVPGAPVGWARVGEATRG